MNIQKYILEKKINHNDLQITKIRSKEVLAKRNKNHLQIMEKEYDEFQISRMVG